MLNNTIILLVGKSGSGKDTIANYLTNTYGLKQLKSYTTRPKRYKDEDTHTFVTEAEFAQLDNLVAYTEFANHKYCATCEQIQTSDMYIIDEAGIETFRKNYIGEKHYVVIYIYVDFITRFYRMLRRGSSPKDSMFRIWHDRNKFSRIKNTADYVVNNNTDIKETALKIIEFCCQKERIQ